MARLAQAVLLLVFVATMGLGCQSEKEGVQIICDAPKNADNSIFDPAMRMQRLSEDIDRSLSNRDARNLYGAIAGADADERAKILGEAVSRLGIDDCAMLEFGVRAPE